MYTAKIGKIRFWFVILIFFLILYFGISGWFRKSEVVENIKCKNFTSWFEAQIAYEKDPVKYASLDGDGDKIACENL